MLRPSIALVTTATRMQGLLARWGTKGAARFRLNQAALHQQALTESADRTSAPASDTEFEEYEAEEVRYRATTEQLRRDIDLGFPVTLIDRQHLPNFDFRNVVLVIVLGQDGLVANTAKYAGGLPIIGINPDPHRIDGILVPFKPADAKSILQRVLDGSALVREVTLARASLNDGQTLLAFNDFFVGRKSHASARYTLTSNRRQEPQSSSGVIISTGAGSTGWLSSVFNMTRGVNAWTGNAEPIRPPQLRWEDRRLAWVVREPFQSRHSQAHLVAGTLGAQEELVLDSLMPESGVVFSDGVEQDFLEFNSGSTLRVRVADEVARLVVPKI